VNEAAAALQTLLPSRVGNSFQLRARFASGEGTFSFFAGRVNQIISENTQARKQQQQQNEKYTLKHN